MAVLVGEALELWSRYVLALVGKELRGFRRNHTEAQVRKAYNRVMKKALPALSKATGKSVREAAALMKETLEAMAERSASLAKYRGIPLKSETRSKILKQYVMEAGMSILDMTRTQALSVTDPVTHTDIALPSAIMRVFDAADAAVIRGEADFNTAVRDAIKRLGGSGVRVRYNGITRRLDSVVRQNVLYETKQAAQAYSDEIGRQTGCDGFEVDWHHDSRPSHVFMQGRQFALHADQEAHGKVFPGAETTRDAESGKNVYESLDDYGCRHYKMPIILGISVPAYTQEELNRLNEESTRKIKVGNREKTSYEWSQVMRQLEADTRKEKDMRVMAEAAGDREMVRRCDERIRIYREKYLEISQATGIKEDLERMVSVT